MISVVYTGTREPQPVEGLELHHLPMLERTGLPLRDDVRDVLANPETVAIFYSKNAADCVLGELSEDDFAEAEIWAVGARTAKYLSNRLARSIHRPDDQEFHGLVEALRPVVAGRTVVSFELEGTSRRLSSAGLDADVISVDAYATTPCHWDDLDGLLRRIGPQWVVFTSPRGYESFADNLHHRTIGDSYRVAAIGSTTRDAILRAKGRVDFVPNVPSVPALLRELMNQ